MCIRDRVGAADRGEALPFDGAEELGLGGKAQFPKLVEEEGSAVGPVEAALAVGQRARERSFLVAEKLAFKEVFGDGPAVHRNERLVAAGEMCIRDSA